jgi:hypothetical protein
MRWLETFCLSIVLALGLALSAENARCQSEPRAEKHQATSAVEASGTDQHPAQPQVPLSVFESSQATFRDVLRTIREQSEAEIKKANGEQSTSITIQKWLLAVGIAYTIFACFQWWEIRRQAKIANDTVRPWILLFVAKWPSGVFPIPVEGDNAPRPVACAYNWKNFGKTPCWIVAGSAALVTVRSLDELPPEPNYPPSVLTADIPVAPDTATPEVGIFFHPNRQFVRNEILEVERREVLIYAYGYARYRDVSGTEHETRFGGVYAVPPEGVPIGRALIRSGPRAYNRHT